MIIPRLRRADTCAGEKEVASMTKEMRRYQRRGLAPIWLALLLAVGGVVPLMMSGAEPAQAGPGTDVFFTPTGRVNPETIVAFINGPAVSVDFRVRNVTYPTGLGAFQFDMSYDTNVANPSSVTQGPFLGSTNRTIQCINPVASPGSLSYSCNSIGPGAPTGNDGPQGAGVLARLMIQPGASFGFTQLVLNKTHLEDITGDVPISHASINGSLLVAKCGDFSSDNIVTIGDMVQLIGRFGTFGGPPASANWDPRFDLNTDVRITVGDMLIEVQEFGMGCVAS
jgi:hypothetical protein